MNTERHEELAALAALDLLSPEEQNELNAELARTPELQALIDSLRETAADLAHTAPSLSPPAALKARLLSNIAVLPAAANSKTPEIKPQAPVLKFANPKPETPNSKFPAWPAWLAAACLAVTSAWLGQNYLTAERANAALRDQQTLADLALHSAQNQLEAERIIAKRELADASAKVTESARSLAALQIRVDAASSVSTDLTGKLQLAQSQLDLARTQLADARATAISRDLRIADLDQQLKTQGDLANYRIATLASLAGNSPQALAIAVWNPANQQGVLSVQKLPALATDKDYQLWVIGAQEGAAPISAGVFTVDPATGEGRLNFRPVQAVKNAAKFAISLERKGGSSQPNKPEGQVLFLGQ